MQTNNPRAIATKILNNLIQNNISFTVSLKNISELPHHAFIQELCYGVARWYFQLDFIAQQLLKKPIKEKDQDIYTLILIGLYQLLYTEIPTYAAVSETVNTAYELKKNWAKSLINAVLRHFLRKKDELLQEVNQNIITKYSHPQWLIQLLRKTWPNHWEQILWANNQHPPMSLRINQLMTTKEKYLAKNKIKAKENPYCPFCLTLKQALPIDQLPGFHEGHVSIQDCGAQLAAELLDLKPNQRVLDACAAPGSKTTHILEIQPKIQHLVAIDKDKDRIKKIKENLDRLHLKAELICADAIDTQNWWNNQYFDRILLDAPCSATGVIRRHPDIKLLKQYSDIKTLQATQFKLLQSLWPLLKPQGQLVYVTCSILPEENQEVIKLFLEQFNNAREYPIKATWGYPVETGRQILPGSDDMDGFYYAVLEKTK